MGRLVRLWPLPAVEPGNRIRGRAERTMPESLDRRDAGRSRAPRGRGAPPPPRGLLIAGDGRRLRRLRRLRDAPAASSATAPSLSGNVIFFLLINLNLILLVLLVFLVTRNLVKLIFERRRGILGSRLRTRLVLAFVSLSLFPTMLLFLVAEGFLSSGDRELVQRARRELRMAGSHGRGAPLLPAFAPTTRCTSPRG